jgi:hypothetical protein
MHSGVFMEPPAEIRFRHPLSGVQVHKHVAYPGWRPGLYSGARRGGLLTECVNGYELTKLTSGHGDSRRRGRVPHSFRRKGWGMDSRAGNISANRPYPTPGAPGSTTFAHVKNGAPSLSELTKLADGHGSLRHRAGSRRVGISFRPRLGGRTRAAELMMPGTRVSSPYCL